MFKINNNNFKILIKYKDFEKILSDYLINIPKTDKFYKENKDNKYILTSNIKTNIMIMDYLLEIFFNKKGICDKGLNVLGEKLVEINKMVTAWADGLIGS